VLYTEDQRRRQRRIDGAEAWIEAWRRGRGRLVDREALEASGVLKDTFKERVVALAEKLQGDGHRLVERLKTGAVERFRWKNAEKLEQWLVEHGYIVAAQPLDPVAVERRTASAMVIDFDDPEDGKAEAQELARSLAAGVFAGSAIRKSEQVVAVGR
jgi:DNA repair protein SbcC/Rad50